MAETINITFNQLETSSIIPSKKFAIKVHTRDIYDQTLYAELWQINNKKTTVIYLKKHQYFFFVIKGNVNEADLSDKLAEGFNSQELFGHNNKNKYGNLNSIYEFNANGAYNDNSSYVNAARCEMAKIFVNWIHTQDESLYASLCKRGETSGFTVVMVNWHGVCTVINKSEFQKYHRTINFKVYDADPFTMGFSNISGFFIHNGYLSKGKYLTSNSTYFLYNNDTYRSIASPTDATTIYSKYNSYEDKTKLMICQCQNTIQTSTGGYYSSINAPVLSNASYELDNNTIIDAILAGVAAGYNDYLSQFDAPTWSSGISNAARSYITDLEAYTLKFTPGIDNTSNSGNSLIHHGSKANVLIYPQKGPNNIYVQIKKEIADQYVQGASYFESKSTIAIDDFNTLDAIADSINTIQTNLLTNGNPLYCPVHIVKAYKDGIEITLEVFFEQRLNGDAEYELKYFKTTIENGKIECADEDKEFNSFNNFLSENLEVYKNFASLSFTADLYVDVEETRKELNLLSLELFEAHTRGRDFIEESYTEVRPQELKNGKRLMTFDDNYFTYKYTGRNFKLSGTAALVHEKDLLMETDVTLGDTYGKQTYFIEAIKYKDDNGEVVYKDTFKEKDLLKAIDATKYTEDDYKVLDGIIDLDQCEHYKPEQATYENQWCDCYYNNEAKECYYQKYGICPYRFTTEKHPRRIRTLEQSKSNRFNLIQEISKIFECYPQFNIEYDTNGKVLLDDEGKMKKHISFITEKGSENYSGFRYEKNLSGMSRSVDSSTFTTKLYVETVDSQLTETGICSIQTAPDNIGKNAYVLDFTYYTDKGLLNKEQTQRDVWGIDSTDLAFLPTIGLYNSRYDELTNLILNLQDKEMTELQAKNEVSITGVTTALEERKKVSQRMYQFKVTREKFSNSEYTTDYTLSDTYLSYLTKYREQATILFGLLEDLFFSKRLFTYIAPVSNSDDFIQTIINLDNSETWSSLPIQKYRTKYCLGELFWRLEVEGFEDDESYAPPFSNWLSFKEKVLDNFIYQNTGKFGQYVKMYNQVKYWKKERQKILNKINDISEKFYNIYEPYIKEGTWTDSNYLTDNGYYWAAEDVLADSSKPQVTYSFKVIDISPIDEYEDDYNYDIADTTFVEDIDFFGISSITGLPNHQKVLISSITDSLDVPTENTIEVQNYTSQFEDLFEQITASVQSLTYNENTYKRASNFTAKQYVQSDSLQGTLDQGNLTLVDANNSNIILDDSGTTGAGITNNASQYKLTGEGLYFSTDGGETWDVGVGPEGYNLDYAKFGQLDASKVQIVDGEYIYFLWDKNGINAYRNPATSASGLVDFARFNRYGLSLIENNHVRLRAGYEFKTTEYGSNPNGEYQNEIDLKDQNIGFYLYNDSGQPIFKTETASEYNDYTTDYSARLSLQGEMFITNSNLSDDPYQNGSAITSQQASKLSIGYIFSDMEAGELSSSVHSRAAQRNLSLYGQAGDNIITQLTIEANSNVSLTIYKVNSTSSSTKYSKVIGNNGLIDVNNNLYNKEIRAYYCYIENTNNDDVTITNLQKIIDKNVEDCNIVYSESNIEITLYQNTTYQEVTSATIKILEEKADNANYTTTTDIKNSLQTITYFDKDDNYNKVTKRLYFYSASYNLTLYNYWERITNVEVENGQTAIATNEVVLYLNNKLLNSTGDVFISSDSAKDTAISANQGGERVFMVGLRGTKNNQATYRNVMTVLKNGILYIGGEIRAESGAKLDMAAGRIPDRVRINDASMIVANNGYVWLDLAKTFGIYDGKLSSPDEKGRGSLLSMITTIYDSLSEISDGSSGSDSDIPIDGYYLEEPIE